METIDQVVPQPLSAWDQADFALSNGIGRVLLYGQPGTGKTYYAMNYKLNGKPAYRLVCTEEMTDADLIGMWRPTNVNGERGLTFVEGVAIQAWRTGGRLVVDEINRVNGDIESRLMSLIDTYASSSWQHPETGEVITPHPDFSVVATMNGEPDDLGRAIQDRLVVQLEINEPHPDGIAALPQYLQDMALSFGSRTGKDRYSLRNFVEFHAIYTKTDNIHHSAQVCLPRIAEQLIDTVMLAKVEA
jgi:MoxR-like ATPase